MIPIWYQLLVTLSESSYLWASIIVTVGFIAQAIRLFAQPTVPGWVHTIMLVPLVAFFWFSHLRETTASISGSATYDLAAVGFLTLFVIIAVLMTISSFVQQYRLSKVMGRP